MSKVGADSGQEWPYAGLWVRIQAFAVDYLVILGYLVLFTTVMLIALRIYPGLQQILFGNPVSGQMTVFVGLTLPVILYFSLLESSPGQATWGKRWKNLKVIQTNGKRLSRIRAFARALLKFIPWEIAHTCIWQIRFAQPEQVPIITAGFILVWVLVGANIASLLLSPTHWTLYDWLTGSRVRIV